MPKKTRTAVEKIDPENCGADSPAIVKAAGIIKNGGLVSFPTETVYGLGANALDPSAVKKIFAAKGRPPDNPLIVHISSVSEIHNVARDVPRAALKLAGFFWPGPLTMVLRKKENVPYETTGGLETVAVRLPSNKAARALIAAAGVPVAAPSSNSSGKPSATDASHVETDLDGKIDMILDGGPSEIGLESTVADLTVFPPLVLRPGFVTFEDLKKIEPSFEIAVGSHENGPKSPGMKYKHYSPEAELIIVSGEPERVISKINGLAAEYIKKGKKTCVMARDETVSRYDSRARAISAGPRNDTGAVARNLYKILREFDFYGADIIFAEGCPETGLGFSVTDRLARASGRETVYV